MNDHPITYSITKKAPTMKILNKRPPELSQEPQPSLINKTEPFIQDRVKPITDALIQMPEQIELSVQEVVIESTPSFDDSNNDESQNTEKIPDSIIGQQTSSTVINDDISTKSINYFLYHIMVDSFGFIKIFELKKTNTAIHSVLVVN